MLPAKLLAANLIALAVMLACLALVDRYAKRHPYGTGHFGKVERKRRAHEAHRRRVAQPDPGAKARNEAVMSNMLARARSAEDPTRASASSVEPPRSRRAGT